MAAVFVTERPDGTLELRFPYNQWVVEQLKMMIPGHGRKWDPEHKMWTVFAPWAHVAIDILEEAFGPVTVERPRQQQQQQNATPPPPIGIDQFYADLHLRSTAPAVLIHGAYKILAKLYHPDAGGDTTTMQRINAAYQRIKPTTNGNRP